MDDTLYVRDFMEEGLTDSQVIAKCLKFGAGLPNRIIIFEGKNWYIDEAIELPANTTVIVDGVMIKQNDEVFDNVFRGNNLEINPNDPYHYPLSISPIDHIYIYGIHGAKIEGPDVNRQGAHPHLGVQEMTGDYWGWRTLQICLTKCTHFELSGFELSKTRCWAVSFDKCSFFTVHDLKIHSSVKNGDGVDIRFGCHHFDVYHIEGITSDDTVAMTTIDYFPTGNYVYPMEPSAFENDAIPAEQLAIHTGYVDNICTSGKHHGVICLSNAGRKIYDIEIRRIKEPAASTRESVVKIYAGYGSGYIDDDIHNIRIHDVVSKGAQYAVQVTPKVKGVWFHNIVQENVNGALSNISNMDGVTITNQ